MTTTDEPPTDEPTDGEALPATTQTDDAMLAALKEHAATLTVEDPAEVQERIVRQILRAQTPEDLLRAGEATPSQEVYGVPLRITGIRASESDFEEGNDLYLHIEATIIGNGDQLTVSCGARDVCAKLIVADMRGWFPIDARIEKAGKPTKDGFYPVFLRMLDGAGKPF